MNALAQALNHALAQPADALPAPSIAQVMQLQTAMQAHPELQVELQVTHHFDEHVYGRELFMPAGAVLVGRMHATRHLLIVCCGTVRISAEGLVQDITGPCVLHTTPGTKRVIAAITDATLITIHVTDETDVDKIGQQILLPDPTPALETDQ